MDCDSLNAGCGGGLLDDAWKYMASAGIAEDACDPYLYGPFRNPFPLLFVSRSGLFPGVPSPILLLSHRDAPRVLSWQPG